MQTEQKKVIMIKDDQEENQCNNKIVYLRSQRLCERKSRLCSQRCEACEDHGDERFKKDHTLVQIQKFKKSFQILQESCRKETQHYIRQMNDAEKKATDEIRRKKNEYIKQIEEVKAHMMKMTYRTLEEKYTNLYDKYKNERFEGLKCCEVFWVMNALPSDHSIKHSEINKKLEGILKKFQSFKQVSRNLQNENMFNPKQKVKKSKISQKIGPAQVRKDPVQLQKVSYDGQLLQKYKRAITAHSQQLKKLKTQKMQKQKQLCELELQLKNRLKKIDFLRTKLSFQTKNINIKYPDSEIPFQLNFRQGSISKPLSKPTEQQNLKENKMIQLLRQLKNRLNQTNNNSMQQNRQESIIDKQPNSEMIDQNQNSQQSQKENNQKQRQVEKARICKANKTNLNVSLVPQNTTQVKLEAIEQEPFIQWQDTQLVQQIRKYGKSVAEGLKVQEIDKIRSFNYVKPPITNVKINSSLLKKPQSLIKNDKLSTPEKKVTNFSILASSLFQRHQMKKQLQADKQQKTDKSQKKLDPNKQS